MAYESLLYEVEGNIAVITVNRPEVMNALNPAVGGELIAAFIQAGADDSIRCVVLTGAGEKAFVAGADISAMVAFTPEDALSFAKLLQEVTVIIEDMPKPVIAACNGFALGGGTELALACDFIYASDNAMFGQPEINLGVIPGAGGTQRLPRLVGKNWARELCLTGELIDAATAKEIGLVNRVLDPEDLMPAAMKTARKIAAKGAASTRSVKHLISRGPDLPLEHALRWEAEAFALCFANPDQKEGMRAFLEKRKPDFGGNG